MTVIIVVAVRVMTNVVAKLVSRAYRSADADRHVSGGEWG